MTTEPEPLPLRTRGMFVPVPAASSVTSAPEDVREADPPSTGGRDSRGLAAVGASVAEAGETVVGLPGRHRLC